MSDGKKVKERKRDRERVQKRACQSKSGERGGGGKEERKLEGRREQGREHKRVRERSNSWNVEKNINYTYAIKTNVTHLAFYISYSNQIIKPNH